MTPHCREFYVTCCVASRIACSNAENVEKEDVIAGCWVICEILVTAQPTSLAFLNPSV